MAGTKEGGKKAAATNKLRKGEDFYKKIGAKGGAKGTTGGFHYRKYELNDTEWIAEQGRKGGKISKKR